MERNSRDDAAEAAFGVAAVLTGGGVLTFALFPLLLPTVVLLGALALPLLPLAVLGALAALLFALVRGLGRLARSGPRRLRAAEAAPAVAHGERRATSLPQAVR